MSVSNIVTFDISEKKAFYLAIVLASVLGIAITWPVFLSPNTLLIGHPGNDTWNHVWGYWWVAEAVGRGEWPINADKLAFPNGGTLYFIDTMQAVFALPISFLIGPVAAFNLVVIGELIIAGVAAWLLAYKVTADKYAACTGLVLFELSAHLLGQTYNGISETVCAGWFPLTLWALLRLMEQPNWKRALQLGLIGAMTIVTSWYYGLFAILGSLVIILWSAIKRNWLYEWRKIGKMLLVSAGVSAVCILGPVLSFRNSLQAENAIVTRDPEFVERSLLNHNITDVQAFFQLSKIPIPDLEALYGEQLLIIVYLGWIGISLSIYAMWTERRKEEWKLWGIFLLVFLLFCLGPYLHVGGEYYLVQGKKIPLPFLVLYKAFPIFDRISHPFRFVIGVNLALAMLASHGMRVLLRSTKSFTKMIWIAVFPLLVWGELSLFSPAQLPIPHTSSMISSAYTDMNLDENKGAVLDLPLSVPNLERAIYVWNQSQHNRAIPWGLNDPMPQPLRKNLLTQTLLQIEGSHAHSLPPIVPELDLVISSRVLSRQGYRYIVVHENNYPTYKLQQVHTLLHALFGQGKEYTGGVVVYTIDAIRDTTSTL